MSTDDIGRQMVAWGKVAIVETRGRRTGEPVLVAVGFVPAEDGGVLVAAGEPDADWARNLAEEPRCRVTIGDRTWDATAEGLPAKEAVAVVRDLILRYGTPAERLGRGPAFRLRPASADTDK